MTLTRASAIILALMGLGATVLALQSGLWSGSRPGPGLFPFIAAVLLSAASLGAAMQMPLEAGETERADRPRVTGYMSAITGFVLLLEWAGTMIAMVGLLLVLLRAIERRSWTFALASATFIPAFSWLVFRLLLGVPLPRGWLGIG